MRQTRVIVLTCGTVIVSLLLSGCTDDSAPGSATTTNASPPPATTRAAPSTGTTALASCVVGRWLTTALSAAAGRGPANAALAGGAGIGVTIGPDGVTTIAFTDMQPITFTAGLGAADIRGSFTYAGRATGTMTTGPATSTAATGNTSSTITGTWQPAGDINWDQTRLTVDLTEPVRARPLDNVSIGQYAGDAATQTGNVVDIDPLFDNGTYTCGGNTLTVNPDKDGDLPLTLERA